MTKNVSGIIPKLYFTSYSELPAFWTALLHNQLSNCFQNFEIVIYIPYNDIPIHVNDDEMIF